MPFAQVTEMNGWLGLGPYCRPVRNWLSLGKRGLKYPPSRCLLTARIPVHKLN